MHTVHAKSGRTCEYGPEAHLPAKCASFAVTHESMESLMESGPRRPSHPTRSSSKVSKRSQVARGFYAMSTMHSLLNTSTRMGNADCAQALATRNCSACASDAAASKVAVVASAAHSEDLYIYSHSKVCERKTTGGDAWVVEVRGWDFHHGQSQEKVRALKMVWRAPAKDLGDGRYVARLPHLLFETNLTVGVSVSLWWTRADPSWSLEHSWNQVRPQRFLHLAHHRHGHTCAHNASPLADTISAHRVVRSLR